MPDSANSKTSAAAPARSSQERPRSGRQSDQAGPFQDITRLHNLAGNRAVAGLFAAATPSPVPSEARPLDPTLRASMESRFGVDFGQVRIHAGNRAADLARSRHARAFTQREHIVFAFGQFDPFHSLGRRLLAHELTHVIQQSRGGGVAPGLSHEQEAETVARFADAGSEIPVALSAAAGAIQCDSSDQHSQTPEALVDRRRMEFYVDVDAGAENLVKDLLPYAKNPAGYAFIRQVFRDLPSEWEDNVAAELVDQMLNARLDQLARTEEGLSLLNELYEYMMTGSVSSFEREQGQRIVNARKRRPNKTFNRENAGMILPVRNSGPTRWEDASFEATLREDGKIHVEWHIHGSMFAEEKSTLSGRHSANFDPDQIVGLKLYDQNQTVFVPALQLIDFSNQLRRDTLGKIVQVAATAAFGFGGLGGGAVRALAARVAAGEASTAALWAAKAVLWADRVAFAIDLGSMVINDHRDWILRTFPKTGEKILAVVDEVNTIAAYYGWARLGFGGIKYLKGKVQGALKSWRAEPIDALPPEDAKLAKGVGSEMEEFQYELEEADAQASGQKQPEGDAAPQPAATQEAKSKQLPEHETAKAESKRAEPMSAKQAKDKPAKGVKKETKPARKSEPRRSDLSGDDAGKGSGSKKSGKPPKKGAPKPAPSKPGGTKKTTSPRSGEGGLTVEITSKQSARLRRVREALEDETKWVNVSPKDRWRLGRVYDSLVEKLTAEAVKRTGQKVLHYVELTPGLVRKLRAEGKRVLFTEVRLPGVGRRFDLLEVDFAHGGKAELRDLTATPSALHVQKTRLGKEAVEKTLGTKVNATELYYTGPNGELLEDLVEVDIE